MMECSVIGILAIALYCTPGSAAPDAPTIAEIDRQFVCPEALPNDQARSSALKTFMDSMGKAAPDEGIVDVLRYRKILLQKHNCTITLNSLQTSRDAILNGAVLQQAWLPILSNSNVSLSVSVSYIESYIDPRYPSSRAIDAYVKTTFAANLETNVTHHLYDELVSHNVYYCDTKRYALIENDYFLSGNEVFKDPSSAADVIASTSVYETTPIPSGSLNEVAARWACSALRGSIPT